MITFASLFFRKLVKEEWQSWFNAPVLKTGVGNTTGGSNPSSSASRASISTSFDALFL